MKISQNNNYWLGTRAREFSEEKAMAIRGRIGKIIAFQGALCPDEEFRGLRNGRRYVSLKNADIKLQQKPRQSGRKSTLANYNLNCHRHGIRAMEMLVNPELVEEAAIAYAATVLNMDLSDASSLSADVANHPNRAEQDDEEEEDNDEDEAVE